MLAMCASKGYPRVLHSVTPAPLTGTTMVLLYGCAVTDVVHTLLGEVYEHLVATAHGEAGQASPGGHQGRVCALHGWWAELHACMRRKAVSNTKIQHGQIGF